MRIVILLAVLALPQAQRSAGVTGKWQWRGTAGWQRIELNLEANGPTLTGILRMGPGTDQPVPPDGYWEYFFDPVEFKIAKGTVEGNSISFEQVVQRPVPAPVVRAGGLSTIIIGGATGGRTSSIRFIYKGTLEGDRIQVVREIAPSKDDPWTLGTHKVKFVLQRIK
jgi:hypothetical protein